jgi:asparagine synthase (glutamine-hydrolysing)
VPLGVLLSGGVDSSLLVALLAETQNDLHTFSIGFEAAGSQTGDEFRYSDLISERFATNHHKIKVAGNGVLDALPSAISAMSEPMVSHDCVAFYLLANAVSEKVKVVQCGQGADEIFGGYSWHSPFLEQSAAAQAYKKLYFDWSHTDLAKLISPSYLSEDWSGQFTDNFFSKASSSRAIDQVLEIDTKIMMVDDPVKRVDNMTMAFGLEARVPFLDHELVELAARVPAALKVKNGGKYVLKEAARKWLPSEVVDRPKGYFPVPALRHLQGPFLEYVQYIFANSAARERGLYNLGFVQTMLSHPEREMSPKGHSRLWQAALLEGWLQAHEL